MDGSVDDWEKFGIQTMASVNSDENRVVKGNHGKDGSVPRLTVGEYQLAAGAAGAMSKLLLFPFDTIKTRLQFLRSRGSKAGRFSSRKAIITFVKREGVAGLYRGIFGALIGVLPYSLCYMPTYEALKRELSTMKQLSPFLRQSFAGAGAGVVGSVVRVPIEMVKKRVQVGIDKSFFQSVRTIFLEGGISAFYRGYRSALAYDVPYNAIQFAVLENNKRLFLHLKRKSARSNDDVLIRDWDNVLLGGLTGIITSLLTEPLDVVRTRLMTQRSLAMHESTVAFKGVLDCMARIVQEEGLAALWKGTVPRLMWVALGSSVWYTSYEFIRKRLAARKLSSSGNRNRCTRRLTTAC